MILAHPKAISSYCIVKALQLFVSTSIIGKKRIYAGYRRPCQCYWHRKEKKMWDGGYDRAIGDNQGNREGSWQLLLTSTAASNILTYHQENSPYYRP